MDSDLARLAVQLSELRQRLLDDGSEEAAKLVGQAFKLIRKARTVLVETPWSDSATAYRALEPPDAEPDYAQIQQAPRKARRAARRQGKFDREAGSVGAPDHEESLAPAASLASLADRWARDVRREVAARATAGLDRDFVLRIVQRAEDEARDAMPAEPERKATERWLIRIASRVTSRELRAHHAPPATDEALVTGSRLLRDAVEEMRRSQAS